MRSRALNYEVWRIEERLVIKRFQFFLLGKSTELVRLSLREKCPHPEFFWSVFSRIRTEYRVQMRESTDQKNSKYGHFLTSRVPLNDSWFVLHDSNWSFDKPYFSKRNIFHESYRVNITQDYMVLKQGGKYQIILHWHNFKTFLSMISTMTYFFIKQKFCRHFLRSRKNKMRRRDN